MSVRYTYLATDEDHRLVVDWFSSLPDEVTVNDRSDRLLYYFHAMATQPWPSDGSGEQEKTPLVFVEKPLKKRGTLWTDSEVYFPATPLRPQFPGLQKISQLFAKWLGQYDLVFSQKDTAKSEWKYYLEGGIQNIDEELYALPRAFAALKSGQYFVHRRASEGALDILAKSLRLRGYHTDAA